ncbi:MAG: alpha/beta hydrolase [Oscillospiraceae bacterium]|nr:alpha/beta hydrolase [Oscillospiraceae bacterium]
MKTINKLTAVILSFILAFSICVPAFAADDKPFENSEFYTVGDYTIHYRVFEAENKIGQIFMIHGFALSSYCFQPLAERLSAEGYTCVVVDLPDFGYSTRETEETELLPREDILYSLMTSLSNDPWYVAGHSMGGFIAIALAQKYPDAVKNLLLYGTSGNDGTASAMQKITGNSVLVNFMGKMMELMGKMNILVRLLLLAATEDLKFTMDYDISYITDPYYISGTGKGVIINFSMIPATNYETFSSLAPVLYVNAANDAVISKNAINKLSGYLPEGSSNITLTSGGHLFIECRAEKTAQVTLEFLSAH